VQFCHKILNISIPTAWLIDIGVVLASWSISKWSNNESINAFEKLAIGSRSRAPYLTRGVTIKTTCCFQLISMAHVHLCLSFQMNIGLCHLWREIE